MLYKNACPRCSGDVVWTDEVVIISLSCLQCGFERVRLRELEIGCSLVDDVEIKCEGEYITAIAGSTYKNYSSRVVYGRCSVCGRTFPCFDDKTLKPHVINSRFTGRTRANRAERGEAPIY